jgi:tetratricopeptide (TPR) repeat protein
MVTLGVQAQNAEVVNAYNYLKYKELDKAKIAIDRAITDPKTGISAKTWYYRGLIYQDITESPDVAVQSIDKESLDKAVESYVKTIELDTKKQYSEEVKKRIPYLQNRYVNDAITAYKAKDFAKAAQYFEKSIDISKNVFGKTDTALLFNVAIAAQNAGNSAKQKETLAKLIELKYPEPEIYRSMAGIYFAEKDTTKGLEYLTMGRAEYPTNNSLMIDELNVYMGRGQSKQIINKMVAASNADPKNKTLKFALGSTYDNMGKRDSAEKAYKEAIAIDSNYFDAYYNLGAMYYNQGVEIYNKVKDLPISKEKEYNAGVAKFKASFKKALPYLEKALEIQPKDLNTLLSLKEVYAKLDNFPKSAEMKKRIEAVTKK